MKSKVMVFAKRRGFTIVELVIVIVVVAVLAAVAIPTLSGVVKEAKISVVSQLAANFNKAVVGNEVVGNSIVTMYDAVCAIEDYGFEESDAIDEDGDYCVVWDSEKNSFVVFDRETKTVCDEENSTPITKLWQVVDDMPDEQDTSLYLAESFAENIINAEVGIDVGNNDEIEKIIYTDIDEIVKDIIIRVKDRETFVDVSNKGNDNVIVIYASDAQVPNIPGNTDTPDDPDKPEDSDKTENSDKTEDSDKTDDSDVFDPNDIVREEGKVVYCVSDGKQYDELSDAMTIGGELILLDDVNECNLQVTQDTILDLRGFKVQYSTENWQDTIVVNAGTLTIKDSSTDELGVIINTADHQLGVAAIRVKAGSVILENGTVIASKCAIYCEAGTAAVINGGEVRGIGVAGMGIYVSNSVELTVNGGYITTESASTYAIEAKEEMNSYSISINGGLIEGTVAHIGLGNLTVNDGEIRGENAGIVFKKGTLTIEGGEISATSEKVVSEGYLPKSVLNSDFELVGAAIHIDAQAENPQKREKATLNIYGGTIKSSTYHAICITGTNLKQSNHSVSILFEGGELVSKEEYESILRHSNVFGGTSGLPVTELKK